MLFSLEVKRHDLKNLRYELGELPDARAEELRQNIAAIDVAMGVTPEPVIPLPSVAPVVPLTPRLQPGVRRSLQYARIAQAEIEAGVPPPDYLPAPCCETGY